MSNEEAETWIRNLRKNNWWTHFRALFIDSFSSYFFFCWNGLWIVMLPPLEGDQNRCFFSVKTWFFQISQMWPFFFPSELVCVWENSACELKLWPPPSPDLFFFATHFILPFFPRGSWRSGREWVGDFHWADFIILSSVSRKRKHKRKRAISRDEELFLFLRGRKRKKGSLFRSGHPRIKMRWKQEGEHLTDRSTFIQQEDIQGEQ